MLLDSKAVSQKDMSEGASQPMQRAATDSYLHT